MILRSGLVGLSVILCCAGEIRAVTSFDGKWWGAVSQEERREFVGGYFVCAVFDARHRELRDIPEDSVERGITEYYRSHPADVQRSVRTILFRVAAQTPRHATGGGEFHPEKYGFMDGDYWRQLYSQSIRRGWIEGFLDCRRNDERKSEIKSTAQFSKDADFYVTAISRWYGVTDDDVGIINEHRSVKMIPDVLFLFRDTSSGRSNKK